MTARDFAVLTLDEKRLTTMSREAFKRRSAVAPNDPRDRALGETIVAGCVKNWLHLLHLITLFSDRPIDQIDHRAKLILAVGLYQLRFLDRTPDHAVVTEAVRQTRTMKEPGLPKASGFINAVLRKAVDEPDVSDKLPPRDEAKAHAELVLSHPPEVFTPMVDLLGTDDALRLCEHDNRIPPTIVRLMKDRSIDDLGDADKQPHEVPGLVVVRGAKQPDFARWSLDRIAQVQDATSFATVGHLDTRPGMTVLDRCCGVGTKTQQLAEVVGMSGKVFATDILGRRIRDLRKLAGKREDLANVTAKRLDTLAEAPDDWPESYDRILIDAPCSNSGVFPRRPEARYAQSEELLQATETTQLGLLLEAWPLLKPGGLVAYATCSIWPRENQQIVEAFRKQTPAAELVEEKAVLPSFETIDPTKYHDGGYVAVLGKPG